MNRREWSLGFSWRSSTEGIEDWLSCLRDYQGKGDLCDNACSWSAGWLWVRMERNILNTKDTFYNKRIFDIYLRINLSLKTYPHCEVLNMNFKSFLDIYVLVRPLHKTYNLEVLVGQTISRDQIKSPNKY